MNETIEDVIKFLEDMAATLDQCDEDNWLDTPEDIAEIYRSLASRLRAISKRGTSAAKSAAPTPAAAPAPKPAPVVETTPEPAKPVAPEPPTRVQSIIDFDAPAKPVEPAKPAAPEPAQTVSRYAAPMPTDDGFSMPIVNWRMVTLAAAAIAIVVLAILGVRALYRVTMTAPEEEQTTEVTTPAPAPTPTPTSTPTETQTPAKVAVDRKPLPLKPFYIDSNHQTETEK